jgi:hypothetical protein
MEAVGSEVEVGIWQEIDISCFPAVLYPDSGVKTGSYTSFI